MPDKPDLDERFSLHPLEGEEVVKRLLDDDPTDDYEDDEPGDPENADT